MQRLPQRPELADPSSLPSLFLPTVAVLLVGHAFVLFVRNFRRSDNFMIACGNRDHTRRSCYFVTKRSCMGEAIRGRKPR